MFKHALLRRHLSCLSVTGLLLVEVGESVNERKNRVVAINISIEPLRTRSGCKPVLHDWCNIGRGMCYPVCGMVRIKEPLLLIGKSSLCGGSGFPLSLSEWSLTICLTPYNRK